MPTVRTSLRVQLNKGRDKAQLIHKSTTTERKIELDFSVSQLLGHYQGKGLTIIEDGHTIIEVHIRNIRHLTDESQEDWLYPLGLLSQNTMDCNK